MAQEFVQAQIKGDKVVLFIKPVCSYCVMAKSVLSKYKFKPGHLEYIDISCRSDMGSIQDYFLALTGARTVLTHTLLSQSVWRSEEFISFNKNLQISNAPPVHVRTETKTGVSR